MNLMLKHLSYVCLCIYAVASMQDMFQNNDIENQDPYHEMLTLNTKPNDKMQYVNSKTNSSSINQIQPKTNNEEKPLDYIYDLCKAARSMKENFNHLPKKFQQPFADFVQCMQRNDIKYYYGNIDEVPNNNMSKEDQKKFKKLYKDFKKWGVGHQNRVPEFCTNFLNENWAGTAYICLTSIPYFGAVFVADTYICPGASTCVQLAPACGCVCATDTTILFCCATKCCKISDTIKEYKQLKHKRMFS